MPSVQKSRRQMQPAGSRVSRGWQGVKKITVEVLSMPSDK